MPPARCSIGSILCCILICHQMALQSERLDSPTPIAHLATLIVFLQQMTLISSLQVSFESNVKQPGDFGKRSIKWSAVGRDVKTQVYMFVNL